MSTATCRSDSLIVLHALPQLSAFLNESRRPACAQGVYTVTFAHAITERHFGNSVLNIIPKSTQGHPLLLLAALTVTVGTESGVLRMHASDTN